MFKRFDTLLLMNPPYLKPYQSTWIGRQLSAVTSGLFGEERPRPMMMWLMVLVALLHVVIAQRLLRPLEPLTQAKPLMMEVALMSTAAPQVSETVTKPVAESKPEPPKPKPPKPLKKKLKPAVRKPVEVPKKLISPIKKPAPKHSEAEEAVADSPPVAAPVKPAAPKVATAPRKAEVFTEANFRPNYGYNPKPVYPGIARRQHWEGRVTLRVQVSADGTSDAVHVHHSSGHEELDDSAVDAVRKWRFIPAKRGDTPVSSSVLVPIIFTLNN